MWNPEGTLGKLNYNTLGTVFLMIQDGMVFTLVHSSH